MGWKCVQFQPFSAEFACFIILEHECLQLLMKLALMFVLITLILLMMVLDVELMLSTQNPLLSGL
jgi:hypothetical protein